MRTWESDCLKRKLVVPESAIVTAFDAMELGGKDKIVFVQTQLKEIKIFTTKHELQILLQRNQSKMQLLPLAMKHRLQG